MDVFIQQLINGLSLGAVYALIAVGYTMVYGVLRLINFAHGDIFMMGAMGALLAATSWFHLASPNVPPWIAFSLMMLFAVVGCALLGFLIERFAYRPLRNQPRLTVLITAIGVSMLLEFGGQHPKVFGPTPQSFPKVIFNETAPAAPLVAAAAMSTGSQDSTESHIRIDPIDMLIMGLTVVLMIVLSIIVKFTRAGMALRAVSFRFDTAALMGINTDRIISFTFCLGSALAGVAGVFWGVKYGQVDPLMGLLPGLKAFVAAVLGGIGNITGAVVGGVLLGLTETMVIGYFPNGSQYKDGVAFVILIVILLIKPSGLFGTNVVEKV